MMGNALMERSFDQYKYVKILSKGEQRINGKKYYVENNLITMFYQVILVKKIINLLVGRMVKYTRTIQENLLIIMDLQL